MLLRVPDQVDRSQPGEVFALCLLRAPLLHTMPLQYEGFRIVGTSVVFITRQQTSEAFHNFIAELEPHALLRDCAQKRFQQLFGFIAALVITKVS